jgi:hypothetical protein
MSSEYIVAILPSLLTALGVYVNLSNRVQKMEVMVKNLTQEKDEVRTILKEVMSKLTEIQVILAKK